MNKQINILILVILFSGGCIALPGGGKLDVATTIIKKKDLASRVTSVSIANNKLTINGSDFQEVTNIQLQVGGVSSVLHVDSKTSNQLIVSAASALALAASGTFNLIMSSAEAQASFPLTITLDNNSVDLTKLKNTGAVSGNIIRFNGTSWVPASTNETQIYQGTWNATTNIPDLTIPSSNPGDYFIVTTGGTFNSVVYAIGDWIISDGYSWQKIPMANTSVVSFQGRKGIITLQPGDYVSLRNTTTNKVTGSKLADIADIDLTSLADGQVLKWSVAGSKWIVGNDLTGAAGITLSSLSATAPLSYNNTTGVFSLPTANVLALPLTGLTTGSGAVTATDSILAAFGKLMSVPSDYISKSSGANITTGTIAVSGAGMITVPTATGATLTEVANVTYVNNKVASYGQWAKGTGSSINYSAGTVGIGTATPAGIFEVQGGAAAAATNATNISLVAQTAGTGNQNGGNVILTPSAKTGTGLNGGVLIGYSTQPSGLNANSLAVAGSVYSALGYQLPTATTLNWGTGSVALTATAASSTADFVTIKTNSTEKMRVDGNGNVGIGTTSPLSILETWATTGITSVSTTAPGATSGGSVAVKTSAFPTAVDQRLGGLFFGATDGAATPTTLLGAGMFGWSAQAYSTGNAGSYLTFETTPTASATRLSRMRIEAAGNVGINVTSALSKLYVGGTMATTVGTFSTAFTCGTSAIDFSTGNTQVLSPSNTIATGTCAVSMTNLVAGGRYTLVVTGTAVTNAVKYTFTGATTKFSPANVAGTAGQDTVYNIIYTGTTAYISWAGGYQ